jgi:DNA modification methylase
MLIEKIDEVTMCCGDARETLRELISQGVLLDSIVTDPPYELGFMGKKWDSTGIAYDVDLWRLHCEILKPGGYLLAFGGSRTYHRLACAIEDAGFEIRDQIMWIYGSGFPKSLDVSKAIDKSLGLECPRVPGGVGTDTGYSGGFTPGEAIRWQGWGTALKPAHEPIVVARKPLIGTVIENVSRFGTGAMNIDGCRVDGEYLCSGGPTGFKPENGWNQHSMVRPEPRINEGRWPANVIHDGSEEVLAAFPDAPGQMGDVTGNEPSCANDGTVSMGKLNRVGSRPMRLDSGSAARFFYCAKASKQDRGEGLSMFDKATTSDGRSKPIDNPFLRGETKRFNHHPTVKPTDLMRYLVRLVTPPGGTVGDFLAGTFSTAKAAVLEGFNVIVNEKEREYYEIGKGRVMHIKQTPKQDVLL